MLSESNKILRMLNQFARPKCALWLMRFSYEKPSLAASCLHSFLLFFFIIIIFFTFARGFPPFMFGIYFSFSLLRFFLSLSLYWLRRYDCVSLIFQLHRSRTEEEQSKRNAHTNNNVKSNSAFCLWCFIAYGIFCGLFFASALLTYT